MDRDANRTIEPRIGNNLLKKNTLVLSESNSLIQMKKKTLSGSECGDSIIWLKYTFHETTDFDEVLFQIELHCTRFRLLKVQSYLRSRYSIIKYQEKLVKLLSTFFL